MVLRTSPNGSPAAVSASRALTGGNLSGLSVPIKVGKLGQMGLRLPYSASNTGQLLPTHGRLPHIHNNPQGFVHKWLCRSF